MVTLRALDLPMLEAEKNVDQTEPKGKERPSLAKKASFGKRSRRLGLKERKGLFHRACVLMETRGDAEYTKNIPRAGSRESGSLLSY